MTGVQTCALPIYFRCYFYLSEQKSKKGWKQKTYKLFRSGPSGLSDAKYVNPPVHRIWIKILIRDKIKKKSADWFVTQFDSWVPSYNYFLVLEHSVFTNKNAWQLLFYQKEKSEKKKITMKKKDLERMKTWSWFFLIQRRFYTKIPNALKCN